MREYLATKGADIASSGTTNLATATGNRVDITGTTTITAFGTLTAGMWKILKFTGVLTLTHNATSLILPGAANITTAAGDMAFATSLGSGNWEVNFYQKASGLPVAFASTTGVLEGVQGANITSATTTNLETATGDYVHVTGTTTITALTLSQGHQRTVVFDSALILTNGASLILRNGLTRTTVANEQTVFRGEAAGVVREIAPPSTKQPTKQIFLSGSGTYTTPSGAVRLAVRMIGGGAGGAGSGTTPGAVGAAGDTTFGTLTAAKGAIASTFTGGAGGAGTNGDINITGGRGANSGAFTNAYGGHGGVSIFGGAGQGGPPSTDGTAAIANTGSGGGGGGQTSANSGGGGGGAGAYVEKTITSPAATYSYAVGAGGTGGTNGTGGNNGANGGSGIIIVEEFYA